MSDERLVYLDSSAIVKLVLDEPESAALRGFVGRRRSLVSSALARTEITRALLPFGALAVRRGADALKRVELLRVSDAVLMEAGTLMPPELRALDAIHLATAVRLGSILWRLISYDRRMTAGAAVLGLPTHAPS